MTYELSFSRTYTNQRRGLPKDQRALIADKVDLLCDDPTPDGKQKKVLQKYRGQHIYRLRAGNYRIFYTYGHHPADWVKALKIELRREDTYEGDEELDDSPPSPEALEELELPEEKPSLGTLLEPAPKGAGAAVDPPLPIPIDVALLTRLGIPQEYVAPLLACRTLNDLTVAPVSEAVRNLVWDCVAEPDVIEVLQQPEYVAPTGNDLLRYKEGELVDFLLKLSPEQQRFVTWSITASGPTLVKGGPGSGKSTVALYRVKELLRVLRAEGQPKPRILFTTYTNALVAFSRQLLKSLLDDDVARVEVRTADSLAREIVFGEKQPHLANQADLRRVMKHAISVAVFEGNALQREAQDRTIDALDLDYLIEEVGDVIEARQLTSLDAYLAAQRHGRTQPLNEIQRRAIWSVREAFLAGLTQAGLLTWQQLRARAEEIVRSGQGPERASDPREERGHGQGEREGQRPALSSAPGRRPVPYDAVIIDEAQDLDPSLLRLLTELCRSPNRLFVTADANQSIYSSSFRWSDVHEDLQFKGRTGLLTANYRSTREIGEAAHSYLGNGVLDSEQAESYQHNGPPPAMRAVANQLEELDLLARFFPAAARDARLGLGACAVLCPTREAGQSIAADLSKRGLEATFMTGQDLDLARRGIKVLTLKSAKGLEFPVVALAGFVGNQYPIRRSAMTDDDWLDALAKERRTMFVAMTRAMRALLVIAPASNPSPLLQGFDGQYWNLK
jgi:superfamily I DNA/RNA helicase/mRNA-degrading endonuclease RelE of RelBE toxin-antitoxin system